MPARLAPPVLSVLAAALGLALLPDCSGSEAPSQPAAVAQATQVSCDWYGRCGEIGMGKKYNTRTDCEVDVAAAWNKAWPSAECDGKVSASGLDLCLKAIDITDCKNGFDFLNTVLVKCGKDKVCIGADAGAGG